MFLIRLANACKRTPRLCLSVTYRVSSVRAVADAMVKRDTPVRERAAKVGVTVAPTPAGLRAIIADDGASPAARLRARAALRTHQKITQTKVARAEENSRRPTEQQTRKQRSSPMSERAAKAGVVVAEAKAGNSDRRRHQKSVQKKVARAEQQVTF